MRIFTALAVALSLFGLASAGFDVCKMECNGNADCEKLTAGCPRNLISEINIPGFDVCKMECNGNADCEKLTAGCPRNLLSEINIPGADVCKMECRSGDTACEELLADCPSIRSNLNSFSRVFNEIFKAASSSDKHN
jgi:hypothetical protein